MCYLMCVFLNSIRIPLLNLIRIRSRLLNCSLPETSKYFVRRHASDLNPPHCRKTPLNKLKIFFYFILIYIQYILLYTYITNILLGRVKGHDIAAHYPELQFWNPTPPTYSAQPIKKICVIFQAGVPSLHIMDFFRPLHSWLERLNLTSTANRLLGGYKVHVCVCVCVCVYSTLVMLIRLIWDFFVCINICI